MNYTRSKDLPFVVRLSCLVGEIIREFRAPHLKVIQAVEYPLNCPSREESGCIVYCVVKIYVLFPNSVTVIGIPGLHFTEFCCRIGQGVPELSINISSFWFVFVYCVPKKFLYDTFNFKFTIVSNFLNLKPHAILFHKS